MFLLQIIHFETWFTAQQVRVCVCLKSRCSWGKTFVPADDLSLDSLEILSTSLVMTVVQNDSSIWNSKNSENTVRLHIIVAFVKNNRRRCTCDLMIGYPFPNFRTWNILFQLQTLLTEQPLCVCLWVMLSIQEKVKERNHWSWLQARQFFKRFFRRLCRFDRIKMIELLGKTSFSYRLLFPNLASFSTRFAFSKKQN